jgi:hypothetical protein
MRFFGVASATHAPIVRAIFRPEVPGSLFLDARVYRSVRLWLRSVPAGRVRVKLSDQHTTPPGGECVACNNHFVQELDVDGEFRPYVVRFAAMKQDRMDEVRPALDTTALFAIEIVAPKFAAYELFVDDVSFVR